ncbi:MAG: ChuX/HutX family heme-like substrate-binding protein [Nitrososphaerales archaeon]
MLEELLRDILNEDNILISVSTGGAIIEMRVNRELPFRVSENWITIGDNKGPCHMHINSKEVDQVRFVREEKQQRTSYSIRLMNAKGERLIAAFFTKMSGEDGKPIRERVERYEQLFRKYGAREIIELR